MRAYSFTMEEIAGTQAMPLSIASRSTTAVVFYGLTLSCRDAAAANADAEMMTINLWRSTNHGGSVKTEQPLQEGNGTHAIDTRFSGLGITSPVITAKLHSESFDWRAGVRIWFPPACRPVMSPDTSSDEILIQLSNDAAVSRTWSGATYFALLGS